MRLSFSKNSVEFYCKLVFFSHQEVIHNIMILNKNNNKSTPSNPKIKINKC